MPVLRGEYDDLAAVMKNSRLYDRNKAAFGEAVNRLEKNAIKAYIGLIASFEEQNSEDEQELQQLIAPNQMFLKLNEINQSLKNDKELSKYLIDMFEVLVTTNNGIGKEEFYSCFHTHLRLTLKSEQTEVIAVYLQILHRFNWIDATEIPIEILKTIIEAVHVSFGNNAKLLNEALLVIESNLEKRQKSQMPSSASEHLLNFMWRGLCLRGAPKHQCNVCYTIVAQLIKVYLSECQRNEPFQMEFLSKELWHFIRAAIESKEMLRRKQAIYILQNISESNGKAVMSVNGYNEELVDGDLNEIWKQYFAVLESLLEIQCNLITSCLDQYLEGIVKHLPSFWYSIIFAMVLKHHNNIVIHYGIEFILRHRISFQHDNDLINGLYSALNNTYLHSEAKISEQNLAKYFQDSDMNQTLNIMMLVNWQSVPLWTMLKSIDIYVQLNQGMGFQMELLLDFLKRSVRVIKSMPEVDSMAVSILQSIGIGNLKLEQMLGLYEVIGRSEILDGYRRPLDMRTFESFIKLNQLSIETKISYFQHAIPSAKEQIDILSEFYEQNRNQITQFTHFEFLLLNTLCIEKSLYETMLVATPRIYKYMKPQEVYTLDGIEFATSLLKFLAEKFISDSSDFDTFDSIYKIAKNVYKIIREKLYNDHDHAVNLEKIKETLTMINMKMVKCDELYPNKMAVLGILSDVMKLDANTFDLSRFDPHDKSDVECVQGLYDCFIGMIDDFKPNHQAIVLSKFLSRFNQLEFDLWEAYQILLAGKEDVSCIFEQTHSTNANQMDAILADALIYGNELKGEEKQVYDFVTSKSRSTTYNQKVRLSAMHAIAKKQQIDRISKLKDLLFTKNKQIYRVRYYTNSHHHSMKLRITQALAFLFRLEPKWDERMLQIILEEANQTNVTHINELIIAETIDRHQMLQIIENIEGNKGLTSMFMVIYYVCCENPTDLPFVRKCIDYLIKYIFVKQIVFRTCAQIVLTRLCEKFNLIGDYQVLYDSIKLAHEVKTSRALKFSYVYKYRFEQIDANHLLHSMYILREIPRITRMHTDECYLYDMFDMVEPSLELHMDEHEMNSSQEGIEVDLGYIDCADSTMMNTCNGGNVQRKLVTYRETFIDRQLWNSLSDEFKRRNTKTNNELIVMASLLTKAYNLGGLSRSSEVFGVKALTLDNLMQLKQNEFTSVSMASEKWMKFFEVKHYNVLSYLMAMKANGYTIVGAEQTAFGAKLHETRLPQKMVLVLGHEKDGIPADILSLLDMAIEIPQFGYSRSLNVHVSASLFMWEYCKQHLIVDPNITYDSCFSNSIVSR